MDPLSVIGIVASFLPLFLSGKASARTAGLFWSIIIWTLIRWAFLRTVYRKDGVAAVILLGVLPDSWVIRERISKVLAGTDTELLEFRRSLGSNMNMVAVAGAIIAQVGITAFTLNGIDQAHWTAAAFFVASLVFGALSVYVSFIVQQELNALIVPSDIATWLSRPLTEEKILRNAYTRTQHPAFQNEQLDLQALETADPTQNNIASPQVEREASVLAAIMLATPASLLSVSLNMFIIGLGVYLGCVYSGDIIPGFGKGGSLGILLFYLGAATVGTFMYIFPRLLKASEQRDKERTAGMANQLGVLNEPIRNPEQRQAGCG